MNKPDNLLDDLVARVLDVLGQVLPASTLSRFREQISQAMDSVLQPFQILRRDDFDGYLTQLARLEQEVEQLREEVERLSSHTPLGNSRSD